MKDALIKILETFGYPIFLQGSLNDKDSYPDTFFTFWNNSVDDGSHYDDTAMDYIWNFDLNVYSTNPNLVDSLLLDAKQKLIDSGWIVGGKGYDVFSDEPTHTGRGMNIFYIET